MKHLYVKFGDLSCIGFWDIVQKTDTQTNSGENRTPPPRDYRRVGNDDDMQNRKGRLQNGRRNTEPNKTVHKREIRKTCLGIQNLDVTGRL